MDLRKKALGELVGSDPAAAQIYMWTDGRFELLGASAQLFCRAKGTPTPKVYWLDAEQNVIDTQSPDSPFLVRSFFILNVCKITKVRLK